MALNLQGVIEDLVKLSFTIRDQPAVNGRKVSAVINRAVLDIRAIQKGGKGNEQHDSR